MVQGADGWNLDYCVRTLALHHIKPRKYRAGADIVSQIGAELRVVYAAQLSKQPANELHGFQELLARLDAKLKDEGRE